MESKSIRLKCPQPWRMRTRERRGPILGARRRRAGSRISRRRRRTSKPRVLHKMPIWSLNKRGKTRNLLETKLKIQVRLKSRWLSLPIRHQSQMNNQIMNKSISLKRHHPTSQERYRMRSLNKARLRRRRQSQR